MTREGRSDRRRIQAKGEKVKAQGTTGLEFAARAGYVSKKAISNARKQKRQSSGNKTRRGSTMHKERRSPWKPAAKESLLHSTKKIGGMRGRGWEAQKEIGCARS